MNLKLLDDDNDGHCELCDPHPALFVALSIDCYLASFLIYSTMTQCKDGFTQMIYHVKFDPFMFETMELCMVRVPFLASSRHRREKIT
jgi:hypothetical protein